MQAGLVPSGDARRYVDGLQNLQHNHSRGGGRGRRGRGPRGIARNARGGRGGVVMGPQKLDLDGQSIQQHASLPVTMLSKDEGGSSPADTQDEEVEAEVCFICTSPVVHQSVAPCNHRTCHICSLRLRALYKTKTCAHCRVGTIHRPPVGSRIMLTCLD